MRKLDLIGQKFGRLVVTAEAVPTRKPNGKPVRKYLCQCDCGGMTVTSPDKLRSGHSQSCGCLQTESRFNGALKHGHSRNRTLSPTYRSWSNMIQRCTNSNNKCYEDYGGRGIRVCDRWLKFENFLADMGAKPEGMTLDRYPDNDGNYEPGNCRWATREQQTNNQRSNIKIWTGDCYVSMAEFARRAGIPYERFQHLYRTKRIPLEQILKQEGVQL